MRWNETNRKYGKKRRKERVKMADVCHVASMERSWAGITLILNRGEQKTVGSERTSFTMTSLFWAQNSHS